MKIPIHKILEDLGLSDLNLDEKGIQKLKEELKLEIEQNNNSSKEKIGDKILKEPVYLDGEFGKYRTEPKPIKVFKQTKDGEKEISQHDNGFRYAIVYNGSEITKEEYNS